MLFVSNFQVVYFSSLSQHSKRRIMFFFVILTSFPVNKNNNTYTGVSNTVIFSTRLTGICTFALRIAGRTTTAFIRRYSMHKMNGASSFPNPVKARTTWNYLSARQYNCRRWVASFQCNNVEIENAILITHCLVVLQLAEWLKSII